MYPTRKAPSPPRFSGEEEQLLNLPPNHPFATYYIPPSSYNDNKNNGGNRKLQHFSSESTLNSSYQDSRYSYSYSTSTSPKSNKSYTSSNSPSSGNNKTKSPTSLLSQPLSPRGSNQYPSLGHFAQQQIHKPNPISKPISQSYNAPHPAYSRSSASSSSSSSTSPYNGIIPTELTLFDNKPKQNLLNDLEFILGKKLNFPFLNSITTTKTKNNVNKKEKKDKKDKTKRLTKEKPYLENWEWESLDNNLLPDPVVVVEKKKGRGVREGNYI